MNFPIPVNLTVAQNNVPVNITVSDNSESIGLDIETQIVASVASEYEGPYSVTPSESVQTLETAEKVMTDDVIVNPAPPAVLESYHEFTVSPYGTPDENGVINVKGSNTRGYFPVEQSGWVTTSNHIAVAARIDGSIQLPTQAGETITPTETEQTAVAAQKYTTGEVKVGAIPSDYVGSSVPKQAGTTITPTESERTAVEPGKYTTGEVKVGAIPSNYVGSGVTRNDSTDLSVSGATVTAPAGYYAESASASVPNATWKNASTVGVVPDISVDATGLITATCSGWTSIHPLTASGYADSDTAANIQLSGVKTSQLSTQSAATIMPTESEQTAVDVGKYTTGAVKVGAIPSNYVGSSVPTQAAQTITPTTADQTIASGTYLTGVQTIKGDANLLAENIKKDVTIFNVVGSYEGGITEDTLLKALRNQTTSVEDDTLTSIRSYGLAYLTALTSVSFLNLQTISSYAFYNDYSLIMNGWPFPKAKTIGNYAFRYCYGLTGDIVLPSTVTSIGQYSFANCDHMETFTATGAISTLGTYTFNGASGHVMALREIHMPNLGTGIALNLNFGSTTAANACQNLEICDIGKAKSIAANTFANCYKLQTLIMRRTSVTTCANVSAFLNTPLRGRSGLTAKIYVPEALIDSYKAASVWSTINGYGYVEWLAIEGSPYEL